ncbi:ATP-binding protein [Melioribacteraceae bacterium 4301-Me]|uniref:ATP-binding protein n=1 Tax=Pyranulibacter aquaticus TaxID=3163344 RepID=UPI00359565F0
MKKRFLFYDLKKYLEHKNALVITGMRQVGKTTLMKQLFDEVSAPKLWFDLDNPLDMLNFENINYDAIYQSLYKQSGAKNERLYLFIDEIQNLPEITKVIKYLIDKYGVKFIVSGSSNFYLKNLFPESLSGRKFLFILRPMSFKEYLFFNDKMPENEISNEELDIKSVLKKYSLLEFKKYQMDYLDYMEYGGFPEVVVTKDVKTKKEILRNIFASFFEKDIRILSDFKDIRELRDLILLLVPRTGNILDITKLSSQTGINRVKLYGYLEFLQGVFFIKLIPKFSASIDRAVAGGKKVYFADTGLLNVIGRVNEGQLFENAVANQLEPYGELSFYNKRNTAEIDFIVNKEIAFEVKLKSSEKDLSRLQSLCDKLKIKNGYMISLNYADTENTIFPMFI